MFSKHSSGVVVRLGDTIGEDEDVVVPCHRPADIPVIDLFDVKWSFFVGNVDGRLRLMAFCGCEESIRVVIGVVCFSEMCGSWMLCVYRSWGGGHRRFCCCNHLSSSAMSERRLRSLRRRYFWHANIGIVDIHFDVFDGNWIGAVFAFWSPNSGTGTIVMRDCCAHGRRCCFGQLCCRGEHMWSSGRGSAYEWAELMIGVSAAKKNVQSQRDDEGTWMTYASGVLR